MRKLLPILAALLVLPGLAAAEPVPITGEVTVAFGWVKNADGTKTNLAGKKLPFKAYPISTKRLEAVRTARKSAKRAPLFAPAKLSDFIRGNSAKPGEAPIPMMDSADTTVYEANAGTGYGYVENNPSSLDDINLISAAAGKPWSTMTFGMQYNLPTFSDFIIRWRCYETNIDNPPGQTDFSGEFADFGVRWNVSLGQGAHLVEINVAQAAVSTSDSSIFVAQQFRAPHPFGPGGTEDGEGTFKYGEVETVFNAFAPPTIGTSLDQFWYDWDPFPDGNYENSEIDLFEGNVANHVLTIKVASSGTVNQISPVNARMSIGTNPVGTLASVVSNDGTYFKVNADNSGARGFPVGGVEVDFWQLAPGTVTGIRLSGVAGTTIASADQGIDLYDFTNNTWVQVNVKTVGSGFNFFNEAYGGTVPYSHFVGVTNHPFFGNIPTVRARVRFLNNVYDIPRSWEMRLDHLQCSVTTG